jgi:rhodanese-related sulfurtransferase
MTHTRLTALLAPALPLAPVLLALAACGSEGGGAGERREGPSAPFGFELAMAGTAAGADDDSAVPAPAAPAPLVTLTPEELAARLAAGNVRLIDVRTDAEVAEGVIPGAEHIPLDRFDPAALGPDDGREVVLYCRSDRRSGIAAAKLAEATGEPATHLEGGILAWEAAGQPVEKQP